MAGVVANAVALPNKQYPHHVILRDVLKALCTLFSQFVRRHKVRGRRHVKRERPGPPIYRPNDRTFQQFYRAKYSNNGIGESTIRAAIRLQSVITTGNRITRFASCTDPSRSIHNLPCCRFHGQDYYPVGYRADNDPPPRRKSSMKPDAWRFLKKAALPLSDQ